MISSVGNNSYNNNVFRDFGVNQNRNFFLTKPQVEEKSSNKRGLVYAVGSSALLVGLGVLVLMRGLPKSTNKYIEKITSFIEKQLEKASLKGSSSWQEFYIYTLRKLNSFKDKAQSINNFTSLKDILFKNIMIKNKYTSKIHKDISNLFEKISRRTVITSYNTTGKKFDALYEAFDNLDKSILKNNPNEKIIYNGKEYSKSELVRLARAHRYHIKRSVSNFMSDSELNKRYKYIKSVTSNLYQQFWDESFKDFWSKNNKFRRKEMWQTFIPEEKILAGKTSLADQVADVRNKISFNDADKRNLIGKQIQILENLISPSDKEGLDIIKKLKWFLKNPDGFNSNSDVFLRELAKVKERPFEKGLSEAVIENQKKLRNSYIKSINDLIGDKRNGELQEMLAIYEKIAPYDLVHIKPQVTKAVHSFDKSLNLETIEFFDKVRDLELGSAPTDILSILASGGMIAYGLTKAKDHDERMSVTLKAGIPIVGAIATSLYGTAKLISGGKAMLFGLISGAILNQAGGIADNLRKKYSKNPTNSQVA